ncbi:MAG: hypothetical protein K2X81_29475 [Candidatus Obscuribacterales bacterium]|nr:hypothetical protein [Candidatus Obscuribacterales bacterium]
MPTYRDILSKIIAQVSPSYFAENKMPRNLMLPHLASEQAGISLTKDECNEFAPIFEKMIDGAALSAAEEHLLDRQK